jgi:hypothetical protein
LELPLNTQMLDSIYAFSSYDFLAGTGGFEPP